LQEKVVFDTGVYIDLFNRGLHRQEIDGLGKVMFLAHPVLHELWLGARGRREVRHLERFSAAFIRLKRLITPLPATQLRVGRVCRELRTAGRLDPLQPRLYNDVCIALLARQIGATVVTTNPADFEQIARFVDFRHRSVI
jgi:predicted nucleic acid-binding protein